MNQNDIQMSQKWHKMTLKWHSNDTHIKSNFQKNDAKMTLKSQQYPIKNFNKMTQKWHKNDTKMTKFVFVSIALNDGMTLEWH